MNPLPSFSITIKSKEQFVALWSLCVKLLIPIHYDPAYKFFQAFPILEEDRHRLLFLNRSFYDK